MNSQIWVTFGIYSVIASISLICILSLSKGGRCVICMFWDNPHCLYWSTHNLITSYTINSSASHLEVSWLHMDAPCQKGTYAVWTCKRPTLKTQNPDDIYIRMKYMMYGTPHIVMYNDYTQKYREKYYKATTIVGRLRMVSADTCNPTSMVNSVPSLINLPTFCNSRGTGKWNTREKGRYLTKFCYKSPFTNRTSIKRKVTTQNRQRRLHNDYGQT